MKKKFSSIIALLLVVVFVVGACARTPAGDTNGDNIPATDPLAAMAAALEQFPQFIDTGLAHVSGTTFYYGIAASSPWAGIIGGAVFHDASVCAAVASPLGTARSLLSMNEFRQFGQEGVATFEYDLDNLTFTLHLVHNVFWHDGTPLTLDDLVFAYEVMAHPDYTGPRFTAEIQAVTGIMDFRNGYADHIAGLVLSNNNRTLTMHFDNMGPGMFYFGIWTAPTPRHIFSQFAVADMVESDFARTTPVGWGPFMIEHVVPGESASMVRNPYYVWGMPVVERIEIRRVDPSLIAEHMHNGTFDILSFPTAEFGDHMNPTAFTYLGTPVGDYSFIAFRLGEFLPEDPDNPYGAGVNVPNPNRLMYQLGPDFRRAMAYAIDPGFIGATVFNGLQFAAGSNTPPNHPGLIDTSVPGFPYNPARANEILDAAGFTNRDADGMRTRLDGSPLTIYWAFPEAPLTEGIIVPFYIESWANIGVRVELWRGQTHPPLTIWGYTDYGFDYVPGEGDFIHMFSGAWQVGANPNPAGSWGDIWWNFSRYTSPELNAMLDRFTTMEAFDIEYFQGLFSEWQWYWYEQVYFIPLLWTISLTSINNRVTFWDTRHYTQGTNPGSSWHRIGLSAEQPYGR
ncbi:MAG: ABC transporter substrate-binding protein [Defluviitaleaceae bacterium]|nr:ABC transporter substrate-binding protein [Defluviitaleaceae bacterium]